MKIIESIKKNILIKSNKRSSFFERDLFNSHCNNKADLTELNEQNYASIMYKKFYTKEKLNLLPSSELNYCESWVPYQKGKTHLGIYNFFQNNYGIKDPLYTRVSIVTNEFVTDSFDFILNPKESKIIHLKDYTNAESGSVVVQVFHPRAKVILDQFRYFGLYSDQEGGILSGVHSMPLPSNKGYIELLNPKFRSFSWANTKTEYQSFSEASIGGEVKNTSRPFGYFNSNKKLKGIGYITIKDEKNNTTSIWHDGPTPHKNKLNSKSLGEIGRIRTSAIIPDFKKNAPHIFIHESQIGLTSKEFTISLFKEDATSPLFSKEMSFEGEFTIIDTSKISEFKDAKGEINIDIKFQEDFGLFSHTPNFYCHFY